MSNSPGPRLELPQGHQQWWDESRAIPSRARRHVKPKKAIKQTPPGWTVVAMIVGMVLFLGMVLVAFMDVHRGELVSIWHKAQSEPTTTRPNNFKAISVDTVAGKLKSKDHEVEFLEITYDAQGLAFQAAQTTIDGHEALILTFASQAKAQKWVERSQDPSVSKNTWVVSVDDLDLASKLALDLKADLHE